VTPCSKVISIDQSPAAPHREICLIKLGKIVGVRPDGANCPDDRRGLLSAAGRAEPGALRIPPPPETQGRGSRPGLGAGCPCDTACRLWSGAAPQTLPASSAPRCAAQAPHSLRRGGIEGRCQTGLLSCPAPPRFPGLPAILRQEELFRNKKATCCKRSPARFLTPFVMQALAAGENAAAGAPAEKSLHRVNSELEGIKQ